MLLETPGLKVFVAFCILAVLILTITPFVLPACR